MPSAVERCQWVTLHEALEAFARAEHGVRGQRHIKPLHWYVACRLCLEGGFDPDRITPRPPFIVETSNGRRRLRFEPESGASGEMTILGGLKTKQVDVVVTLPHIGPAIAISMKGTLNAFRNLTNRMEEAGGDCTNLHLTYPSLVYAFWHVLRANRPGRLPANAPADLRVQGDVCRPNDVALIDGANPTPAIARYHDALVGLSHRTGIRNDVSRYEAIALTMVSADDCKPPRITGRATNARD